MERVGGNKKFITMKQKTPTWTLLLIIYFTALILAGCEKENETPSPENNWTYLGLEDKWVTTVEDTPWGLFAGTSRNGVFHYNESNNTWTPLGLDHAPISELAFADTGEPMILAAVRCCPPDYPDQGTTAAVYASWDAGETWHERDGGLAEQNDYNFWANSLLVDNENPKRMYFGGSTYQLLYSDDAGKTWDHISGQEDSFGGATRTIALSPKRDGRIWFGGSNAFFYPIIYRSDNWGSNAETIYSGRFENSVRKIIIDRSNEDLMWWIQTGGVAMSEDGGDSVEHGVLAPARDENEYVRFTGLLQSSYRTLYAVGNLFCDQNSFEDHKIRLYNSSTLGNLWHKLNVPENGSGATNLKLDKKQRLLVTTANGLWRFEKE